MNRFKNILVVVNNDGDLREDPALNQGIALAEQNNAKLTLMAIVTPPSNSIMSNYKGIFKAQELTEIFEEQHRKSLSKVAEELSNRIFVEVVIATGRDFIEIIRQVIKNDHDLLLKVANDHFQSFDSSDFHLMRKCPRPVWLLKRETKSKSKKILAAVDLNLESETEGRALNKLIMELASSLAKMQNSELLIVSCWTLYGENKLRNSLFVGMSEEKIENLLLEEENSYKQVMSKIESRYEDHPLSTHLIKGEPVDCIPPFVKDHQIDIVVMGTVARTGIPGLLIGNTAETILQLIDSSVITVKPDGFQSPVY